MKFTLSWLKKFLDIDASNEEISKKLTSIGMEVEEIIDLSKSLSQFIVAEIIEAETHPNAEKLRVCKVNNGKEILQIVCGASNARAGIKVALASIDCVVPTNNMVIKKTKIRDVESCGMLCSASELGLEFDSEGIIELAQDAVIGQSIVNVLGLNNPVFEVNITPNRGDLLGVYGIARDLAAASFGKLKSLDVKDIKASFTSSLNVEILDLKSCPHFTGIYFKNLKNTTSPIWMQNELKAINIEPISALVDITNYLCMTYGQPMHIYDASKISGNIKVSIAKKDEKFTALNNKEYQLSGNEIVISDNEKTLALAGIIGGLSSGCSFDTTEGFLELASFDEIKIASSGRLHLIDTDSRYRFERKTNKKALLDIAKIAANLVLEICGGEASQIIIQGKELPADKQIEFSLSQILQKGGVEIEKKQVIDILTSLGFKIEDKGEVLNLHVPSWRNDVSISEDILEEILRIYGYDNIVPLNLPKQSLSENINIPKEIIFGRNIRYKLVELGYNEIVSWSFMTEKKALNFAPNEPELKLLNPISSELDYMRPSIIPNILDAISKNIKRGFNDISLFEIGPIFSKNYNLNQQTIVSLARTGSQSLKNTYTKTRDFDFYDLKADFLQIYECNNLNIDALQFSSLNLPAHFHPGKSATISMGKNIIAYIGELHPSITKMWDINQKVIMCELFIEKILELKQKSKRKKISLSDYQQVNRDFAFLFNNEVLVGEVQKTISNINKDLIKKVNVFDIFQGQNIKENHKSVALTVTMQAKDRTLTETDINQISEQIIKEVQNRYKGELRG